MKELTQENFNGIIKSGKPTMVDFWADWCGPCRMLSPIIDEIAEEYGDKITAGKVNVDEQGALAAEYAIVSIPTVIFFADGKPVDKLVGVNDADDYRAVLDKMI